MDKVCICIPARYRSTRFDKKLLKNLGDIKVISKTVDAVKKCGLQIYVLTDDEMIKNELNEDEQTITIMTDTDIKNGSERISKNLDKIDSKYEFIVNVQADEPYIDYRNIMYAIEKHFESLSDDKLFYTTLHQKVDDHVYLQQSACITVQFNKFNDVMTYSRAILPSNKINKYDKKINYYGFTGIYVYNRDKLSQYHLLDDLYYTKIEDIEQMKILENGYKIKTYETPYFNEISLNTEGDYIYLLNKYVMKEKEKSGDVKKADAKIKLAVFDFDGVFTDGKIYVSADGVVTKCYNGKDSYGLKLLKENGIMTGLITADTSKCVMNAKHVVERMDFISSGKYDKLTVLDEWIKDMGIDYENVSYIGDDLFDIPVLEKVGLSGVPNDAVDEVIEKCEYICKRKAGDGCVREFINKILLNNKCLQ